MLGNKVTSRTCRVLVGFLKLKISSLSTPGYELLEVARVVFTAMKYMECSDGS